MPNRLFNNLYINAEVEAICDIRNFVVSGKLFAAKSELRVDVAESAIDRLVLRYETSFVEFEAVKLFAQDFPAAHIVFHFYDGNGAIEGFAEFAHGKELGGQVWEDCGGA